MIPRSFLFAFALAMTALGPVRAGERATPAELSSAQALLGAGKNSEARVAFEQILAHVPDDPEANCAVGLLACDDGEWEKALRCATKAVTGDPDNARYQYCWAAANGVSALKAGMFSRLGYAKKCLAAYQRAAELEPRNLQYRWSLLGYYQQAPGLAGGDLAKAYAQAAEIGKIDAESGRQAFTRLYVSEKKYDLAFRQYDEVLRESPDNAVALYQFGRLALTTDRRLDEGLAAFRRCLHLPAPDAKDPSWYASVHWRLGNVWEKKTQPAEARAEYLTALQLDPSFGPAKRALEKIGERKI